MTDTAYATITTTDLHRRWADYGIDHGLVVYLDVPHQIRSIVTNIAHVTVTTDRDSFDIPISDCNARMWRVLD